jgi:hypothetical protein
VRIQVGTLSGADALVELLRLRPSRPWFNDLLVSLPLHEQGIRIIGAPRWQKLNDPRLIRIQAEAYRTWWSLSLAPGDDPQLSDLGAKAADFAQGTDSARRNALRLYQKAIAATAHPQAFGCAKTPTSGRGSVAENWNDSS